MWLIEEVSHEDKEVGFKDKLSKIAGVTYNTIIKIESGATSNPRVETLKQIADALGVGIDDLVKK